jgi:hypothetical protein
MLVRKISGAVIVAAWLGLVPAYAQSIQTITSGTVDEDSIVIRSCAKCPPLIKKKQALSYDVKPLAPGTQRIETVKLNGEDKILRTEAWNGGSPVVFVSKAQPGGLMAAEIDQPMPVDPNATTAAVPAQPAMPPAPPAHAAMGPQFEHPPEAPAPVQATAFDPSGYDLRLK